jgi:hypothetical protein
MYIFDVLDFFISDPNLSYIWSFMKPPKVQLSVQRICLEQAHSSFHSMKQDASEAMDPTVK